MTTAFDCVFSTGNEKKTKINGHLYNIVGNYGCYRANLTFLRTNSYQLEPEGHTCPISHLLLPGIVALRCDELWNSICNNYAEIRMSNLSISFNLIYTEVIFVNKKSPSRKLHITLIFPKKPPSVEIQSESIPAVLSDDSGTQV